MLEKIFSLITVAFFVGLLAGCATEGPLKAPCGPYGSDGSHKIKINP